MCCTGDIIIIIIDDDDRVTEALKFGLAFGSHGMEGNKASKVTVPSPLRKLDLLLDDGYLIPTIKTLANDPIRFQV